MRRYPAGVSFYVSVVFDYVTELGHQMKSSRSMTLDSREGEDYATFVSRALWNLRRATSFKERQDARILARETGEPFDPESIPLVQDIPDSAVVMSLDVILNELPRPRRGWRRRRS